MTRSSRDEQWKVAAELRESIEGNHGDGVDAHSHTGLVGDDRIRRLLNHLATYYDPREASEQYDELNPGDMPSTVEETELYQMLLGNEATETLTRATHNNDPVTMSAAVGDPAAESDISGLNAIGKLQEIVGRKAPILYIFGEPGSGKTNFSLLLSQLWRRSIDGECQLISNIRTWDEADRWIPTYGKLMEVVNEQTTQMDTGGITQAHDANPTLFVFDEASSHASGRGKKGHEAGKKLAPMIYKIRKSNMGIIIIGHDGKDVHPAVRTLSTVVQRYRGKFKRATIWESVKNRQGEGKIMELDQIPETDMTYDDKEATSWDWTGETSEEAKFEEAVDEEAEERAQQLAQDKTLNLAEQIVEDRDMSKSDQVDFAVDLYHETELSQNQIAGALDITQSSISQRLAQEAD
jgi:hypothetical protein